MSRILDDIKSGTFSKVYLICGEEAYLRRDRLGRLLQALLPENEDMNVTRFAGKDVDAAQVMSLGGTMPFFSDRRVIVVEDSGWFRSSMDEMAEYVKDLPDYLVLIFCESQIDKKYRLYKSVKSVGCVEECQRQQPQTLIKWIAGYLGHGMGGAPKRISAKAAGLLQARVGDDMFALKAEMDKLTAYTGERAQVTEADIDAVCSVQLQDRIFDMLRAITAKDQKKAMDLYRDLLALKVAPVKILVLLGRQFTQVLYAKELLESSLSKAEMAARIGVPPFSVPSLIQCAKAFEKSELVEAVRDAGEADEAIKTGRIADGIAVEMLIVKYSTGRYTSYT